MTKAKLEERHRRFLNDLRNRGVTNMFGAGPYLVREFGVTRQESHDLLQQWMEQYEGDDDEPK
jgi:hypothetical protein